MSEHRAKVEWKNSSSDFEYKTYSRDHVWTFGPQKMLASAAPDYKGSPDRVDPEEAYVAALSSCHMLTFLAVAALKKYFVAHYEDEAVGYLEKSEIGMMCVTRVILHPRARFAGENIPSADVIKELHEKAHEQCFISNSVKTKVTIQS